MDEHQRLRRKLWIEVAKAVAGANNSLDKEIPGRWADAALGKFDETFKTGLAPMKNN